MKDVIIPVSARAFRNGISLAEPMPLENPDISPDREDMARILLDRFIITPSGSGGRPSPLWYDLNPVVTDEGVHFTGDLENGLARKLFEDTPSIPRPMSDSVKNDDSGETLDKWLADYVEKTVL